MAPSGTSVRWVDGIPTDVPSLRFDRRALIAAFKISLAISVAAGLAIAFFDYISTAAVRIQI